MLSRDPKSRTSQSLASATRVGRPENKSLLQSGKKRTYSCCRLTNCLQLLRFCLVNVCHCVQVCVCPPMPRCFFFLRQKSRQFCYVRRRKLPRYSTSGGICSPCRALASFPGTQNLGKTRSFDLELICSAPFLSDLMRSLVYVSVKPRCERGRIKWLGGQVMSHQESHDGTQVLDPVQPSLSSPFPAASKSLKCKC